MGKITVHIIEVQHKSDVDLDGKWYELERTTSATSAIKLLTYFGTERPISKGLRPEECHITGSYAGRPLRIREVTE